MNVLLDSAGDQNAKREERVLIQESEGDIDEFLNAFFIFALVETIDQDDLWPLRQFRVISTCSQGLQKELIELYFEVLLEDHWILFDSGKNLLCNLGHGLVLDELISQRRHQISL